MDMDNCHLTNIVGLCASGGDANIIDCMLMNSIQMRNIADQTFNLVNTYGSSASDAPVLDVNGCSATINIIGYKGQITVKNITTIGQKVSIGIDSGHLIIDSTVTIPLIISGSCKYTNNSAILHDTSGLTLPVNQQYGDKIYLDVADPDRLSGSDYPAGLWNTPSDNLTDGLALAETYNCTTLHLHSNMTASSGLDITNRVVESHDTYMHTLTLASGCITDNTIFKNIKVKGVLGGMATFHGCYLEQISEVEGTVLNCMFDDDVTLKDSVAAHFQIVAGRSHYTNHVRLHVGAAMVNARDWAGMLKIMDKNDATNQVNVGITTGAIIVDTTCTAGQIYIGGSGFITNNAGVGCTVTCNGRVIPNDGVTYSMDVKDTQINDLHDEAFGKWVVDPTGNTLTLYKADGVTVLKQFGLTEAVGVVPAYVGRTPV